MKTAEMTDEQILKAANRSLRVNLILVIGILILVCASMQKAWTGRLETPIENTSPDEITQSHPADGCSKIGYGQGDNWGCTHPTGAQTETRR
jgi:hypothetical protein